MIKVIISYDMQDGKEQECQEYLSNKVAPLLARQNFDLRDIWYTMWGNSPEILGGGIVEDLDAARAIFLSEEWQKIERDLAPLTHNLRVRVIPTEE